MTCCLLLVAAPALITCPAAIRHYLALLVLKNVLEDSYDLILSVVVYFILLVT